MTSPETNAPATDRTSPWQAVRDGFGLILRAAQPERRHLVIGALFLAVAAGLEALGPVLGKRFIDTYLLPRNGDLPAIAGVLVGLLLSGALASCLRYLQLARLAGVAMRSVQRIRETVYGHVLRLPMSFFDRAITGQVVSRVTNDTEAVKRLYVQVLFVMLDSVILLLGVLVAMAALDVKLMLIVALLLPAVMVIVWLYQRMSAPAVARARELRSELNAQMAESIAGMPVLQASGAAQRFAQRYAGVNERHYQARRQELSANAWLLRPALDFMNVALTAAVLGTFGLREAGAATGGLSPLEVGVLYAFVNYIGRVVEPLIQVTMQFSQLQQSLVAASRVNTLLREAEAPRPQAGSRVSRGAVRIAHLDFAYGSGPRVLHDISVDIAPGSFHGIVGHTGSGKTTLLSLLLRFYPAPQGTIGIDGIPIEQLGEDAFREAVGLVPQEPFLLAASARENIDVGRGLPQERIVAAARAARAHEFISALEQGYDTPLGEGGARLSVGQKQLLAIARALAGEPRVLLLDEATSHIDSGTEREVQLALDALRGRVTVIAIAHRLSTIRDADRIVVLNHGRMVELGSHAELMAIDGGVYQRLVELQRIEEREEGDA